MKKIFIYLTFLITTAILISAISTPAVSAKESGTVWMTGNGCDNETKSSDKYDIGDVIYINGRNFDEDEYDWDIQGQPGEASCDPNQIVVSGTYTVDETGAFCFEAYTVQERDCGVYKANFSNKSHTYQVVPEFTTVIGIMTALASIGIFFFIRRK